MASVIEILYEDITTCSEGHEAHRTVVQTAVRGAKPAVLVDCHTCDRSHCSSCQRALPRTALACTCGGPTWPPPAAKASV